jgi:hypothetical protein
MAGETMKQSHLVLIIAEQGFRLTRIPADCEIPPVTVEQQAADPNLGLLAAGGSLDTLVKALNDQFEQVCGQRPLEVVNNPPQTLTAKV